MNAIQNGPRPYSLRKSRGILKWVYSWYKKKGRQLMRPQLDVLEKEMAALDQALLSKQRETASLLAHTLEDFARTHCKKTFFEYAWELILAIIFALIIATIVRQMWFELYEIPTGSMRPTFREQDHLTVTKTAFGINFPLETRHLYFDPSLVQRTSVLIFSGDGLPLPDTNTTYFGIFPYKKRYIKRCIGKPGDSIYFYGGQLYGIDRDGKDIVELRSSRLLERFLMVRNGLKICQLLNGLNIKLFKLTAIFTACVTMLRRAFSIKKSSNNK
jgi:signal peptidase I